MRVCNRRNRLFAFNIGRTTNISEYICVLNIVRQFIMSESIWRWYIAQRLLPWCISLRTRMAQIGNGNGANKICYKFFYHSSIIVVVNNIIIILQFLSISFRVVPVMSNYYLLLRSVHPVSRSIILFQCLMGVFFWPLFNKYSISIIRLFLSKLYMSFK